MVTGQRTTMPRLPALYARAVWQAVPQPRRRSPTADHAAPPAPPAPPSVRATGPLLIEARDLAKYRRVCGFAADGPVPATYAQVLAFPLLLDLMTSGDFPFPAAGAVHVSNTIVQDRAIHESEPLELSVSVTGVLPHPRGVQATVVTEAHVEAEAIWRATSTYLGRGSSRGARTADDSAEARSAAPDAAPLVAPVEALGDKPVVTVLDRQPWNVPANVGRRYAAASGDLNPIHLSAITARPFGFRTPIAHGMWTVARALSQLEDLLIHPPGRLRCDVAFKRPLPLPSTVLMSAHVAEQSGYQPRDGSPAVGAAQASAAPNLGPIAFQVEAARPNARRRLRGDGGAHPGGATAGPPSDVHLIGRLSIG